MMVEFSLYINVMLFLVGILLIFVLLTKQQESPRLVRALLLIYFFVVLQYNFENFKLIGDKLLVGSAAIALFAWIRQPIPVNE
jgi:hypothetical protein